ncbi:hypothetical protein GOP47_0001644 [Adiantum capillus-veneris]|uniref:HP domain-containing protein n=1 Tax=Adiantum capillus-veneris TaxID=13818 RepID=A0A9D4V8M8_ADICA|nr:hypothetical protein GOP47_0001644 [Adiantum capillus-veneris]
MASPTVVVDPAFEGAGQTPGLEVWRIENFQPVRVPESDVGKFYSGDSYIVLKTTVLKSGAFQYDVHFWLGKATSQDEAGTAAIKTVELDTILEDRAVQYREVQSHETDKFLSYFKPCIIPLDGGVASGFKEVEAEKFEPRLYTCKGRRAVRVTQVPNSVSSLNHDDVFILDTESKIYQFNGSTSSIQERAKALEVVQYIKDTYHEGTCDVAVIDDGELDDETGAGEFWNLFGGLVPIGNRDPAENDPVSDTFTRKFYVVEEGKVLELDATPLTKDLLESKKCFVLDCGTEVFVWSGRMTSLEERKAAYAAAEELLTAQNRPKHTHITRVIEGSETSPFRANFDLGGDSVGSEDGRSKVAVHPRLFACSIVRGKLEAIEVFNFTQNDLLSEDVMVLDTYDEVFVWIGENADVKEKQQALDMGQKYAEQAAALEGRPETTPVQKVTEGNEPFNFCKCFKEWDAEKASIQGNSFQKRLSALLGKPAQTSGASQRGAVTGSAVSARTGSDGAHEFVSYERLKTESEDPAPGVDPARRESYLSPEEFKELFGMDSEQFYKLPKWKQEMQKKALDLF